MTHEHYLQAWQESQELAEAMQPLIGRLYRQQGIEITLYGRPLQNASTREPPSLSNRAFPCCKPSWP